MRINAIKTDNAGFKLIAASKVVNFAGCKPQEYPCVFFDWNPQDKSLREFHGNNYSSTPFPSFRDALKHILSKK